RRADLASNLAPLGPPGKRCREMQHDATHRPRDPYRDLEQALAERRGLGRRARRARALEAERLHEDVRGQREQEPELIAEKARAAQAVQGQATLEFLDPVLDVAALTVDLVDVGGGVRQVGDHEPGVVLGRAAGMPDDLGLDDDTPLALPRARRIARLPEYVLGLAADLRPHPGPAHQSPRPLLQARIAADRDDILDRPGLQEAQDVLAREAVIDAHAHARPG